MYKLLSLFLPIVAVIIIFSVRQGVGAQFDPLSSVCQNNPQALACQESAAGQNSSESPITSTTETLANILSAVAGVIAVVVIIIAGITMTMSQGDSGKVKAARDTILYAAIGLVVVALSRAIVFFVVNRTR